MISDNCKIHDQHLIFNIIKYYNVNDRWTHNPAYQNKRCKDALLNVFAPFYFFIAMSDIESNLVSEWRKLCKKNGVKY